MLRGLKTNHVELRQKIENMKESELSAEMLRAILTCLPTAEEVSNSNSFLAHVHSLRLLCSTAPTTTDRSWGLLRSSLSLCVTFLFFEIYLMMLDVNDQQRERSCRRALVQDDICREGQRSRCGASSLSLQFDALREPF